jgi:hypothetical protein
MANHNTANKVSVTSVVVISHDGTIITAQTTPADVGPQAAAPAAGQIWTAEGAWTVGAPANASGDYPILLNGSNANGGFADLLQVTNGELYAQQKNGTYWVRWNAAWFAGTAAPVEGTRATAVSLTVTLPKIPDNAPAGTCTMGEDAHFSAHHTIAVEIDFAIVGGCNEPIIFLWEQPDYATVIG